MAPTKRLGIATIILLAIVSAHGVTKQDPFAPIPESLRPRLIERFNSLIELRRTERWEGLFTLLAVEYRRNRSEADFVRDARQYPGAAGTDRKLMAFAPKDVRLATGSNHDWVISGCLQVVGFRFPVDAFVMARRENNDWYFSDLDAFVPRDTPWRRCSFLQTRRVHRNKNTRPFDD
jgi:hypothetical protein